MQLGGNQRLAHLMGEGQGDFTFPERSQDGTIFLVSICLYQLSVTLVKYWRQSTDREGRAPRLGSFDHSRLVPLLWVWGIPLRRKCMVEQIFRLTACMKGREEGDGVICIFSRV